MIAFRSTHAVESTGQCMRTRQPKVSGVQEGKPGTGLHELSLLARLIKPDSSSKASNFKLNLFGDLAPPATASPGEVLLPSHRMLHQVSEVSCLQAIRLFV